jgi:hypothetical protein
MNNSVFVGSEKTFPSDRGLRGSCEPVQCYLVIKLRSMQHFMTRRVKAIMRLRKAITRIIIAGRNTFFLQTFEVNERRCWVRFNTMGHPQVALPYDSGFVVWSALGSGITLRAGRSRVRFPMSLHFFSIYSPSSFTMFRELVSVTNINKYLETSCK